MLPGIPSLDYYCIHTAARALPRRSSTPRSRHEYRDYLCYCCRFYAGRSNSATRKEGLPACEQVNAASSTASSITCGQQPTEVEVISGAFKYTPKRLVRDWHFKYYCFLCDYHFCLRVVEWNCELHVKCLRCYSRNKVVFGHASREDAPHVASNCFGCYVYRLSDDHDGYESNNE